jgi:hypothetical protein
MPITNHSHLTVGTSATEPIYPEKIIAISAPMTAATKTMSSPANSPKFKMRRGVVIAQSMYLPPRRDTTRCTTRRENSKQHTQCGMYVPKGREADKAEKRERRMNWGEGQQYAGT